MKDRFSDSVAVVTGGSRGIGLTVARALAAESAQVFILSVNRERGEAAAEGIRKEGGPASFIPADVTDRAQVRRAFAEIEEERGGIDLLVNNAGAHEAAPFCEETEELWDRMYRVNVLGTVLPSQEAVRLMKPMRSGAIVNIASKAGVVGEPGHAAYSASKGAVIALTRAMAVELGAFGIRVNAVCPGPVVTDMLLANMPDRKDQEKLAAEAPLGRIGRTEDIAGAVLYLASPESSWCTGQMLSVDGGFSILK